MSTLHVVRRDDMTTDPSCKVDIRSYYKPEKLSSCFSLRPRNSMLSSHGLVYQFLCKEYGCNATYIGYTMNSLQSRARQHRYSKTININRMISVIAFLFYIVIHQLEVIASPSHYLSKLRNPYQCMVQLTRYRT